MDTKIIIVLLALLLLWSCQADEYEGDYFTDYQACRDNGFTKEFCLQRPNPNECICDNGQRGTYMPGYGSRCVCDSGSNETTQTTQPKGWYIGK